MKIRSINPTNISKLRSAFYDLLLEHRIAFDTIGLTEDKEDLILLFEDHVNEKGHAIRFPSEGCIGHEPEFIAQQILQPMLKDLPKR